MGDKNRSFQHHGFGSVLSDDGLRHHRISVIQRCRIQLCSFHQDIVPAGHGHLRSHGCMDTVPGHGHLMDLAHIADTGILTGKCGVVVQITPYSAGLRFCRGVFYFFKLGNGLLADRACIQFRQRFSFFFLIPDRAADDASINCHTGTSFFCFFCLQSTKVAALCQAGYYLPIIVKRSRLNSLLPFIMFPVLRL